MNVLIMLTYLIVSKPLYLLTDREILDQLSALEQVRVVIKTLQTSMMVPLTKIVSNVNLKTITTIARRLILDAW